MQVRRFHSDDTDHQLAAEWVDEIVCDFADREMLVSLVNLPWFQNDTPATMAFQEAVQDDDMDVVDDPAQFNANFLATWAAGTVFAQAAGATLEFREPASGTRSR